MEYKPYERFAFGGVRKPKQKKQSTTVVLVQPSAPTASIAPAQAANSSRNNKRGSRGAKRRRKSTRPTDRTASEECARAAGDPAGAAMAAAIARIAPETTVEPEKTANLAERPRNLPGFKEPPWELQYHVEHIERQLQPLLSEPMLGIDVEWRPTFVAGKPRNKIALVQVSSRTRCVLVPVRHLDVSRLPTLGRLLGDPKVWKVGCGVAEDAEKLLSDCGLRCAPTLEIGKVATRLQAADGLVFPALSPDEMVRPGLAGLSLACGHVLSKPKSVSRSDWERRPLTPQQQRYAALDAYSSWWIAACVHALHIRKGGHGGLASWCAEQQRLLCGGHKSRPEAGKQVPCAQPRKLPSASDPPPQTASVPPTSAKTLKPYERGYQPPRQVPKTFIAPKTLSAIMKGKLGKRRK